MKTFITLKVGYSKGIYGCSGEYFNTIIINGKKITGLQFLGMYGAEERINALLKDKGFTQTWIPTEFGQLKRTDNLKLFISENQALDVINGAI